MRSIKSLQTVTRRHSARLMNKAANGRCLCSQSILSQYANITNYYSDSENASLYNELWGESNFHPGYFPHLLDSSLPKLSFVESASELSKYMIAKSNISSASNVIDFGCGKGGPSIEISKLTQCYMLGIDLTEYHIEEAMRLLLKENDTDLQKRCTFECNSFVDGLDEKHYNKYTHVFSQIAINHVQNYFEKVCDSAANVLQSDGILIWADFIGSKSHNDENYLSLLNRLHLPMLLTHDEYHTKIEQNGFKIESYENLNGHVAEAYAIIAQKAKEMGKDECAKKWTNTANLAANDQFGMNVVVASKK